MSKYTKGPLTGLVVLDMTRVLSGPFCTMMFRDMGATIIKVEQPGKGDDSRAFGPFIDGESAYSSALNRGKNSIALNLKGEDDRKIFEKLIKKSDVVISNFRPGVMERLRYSWKEVQKINPAIVYTTVSGFGQHGPESLNASYDLIAQAMSGMMSITGDPAAKVGVELGDLIAGIFAGIGTCAALHETMQTGKGRWVSTSMLDGLFSLMVGAIGSYSTDPESLMPISNSHRQIVPFTTFATKDKQVALCAANDKLFAKLCDALEHPEWATDERFSSNQKRKENEVDLIDLIQQQLITQGSEYWYSKFLTAGVPMGPVNSIEEALNEPQLIFRNMIAKFQNGTMSDYRFPGNPIKFSDFEDHSEYPRGPQLDEQRDKILAWLESGEGLNEGP